jgi:predicted nucleic acid-binding protein
MWPTSLVVDSGALIALARVDLISLPARYFNVISVTAAVLDEVMRGASEAEAVAFRTANDSGALTLVDDPDAQTVSEMGAGIGMGERTSIALARSISAALLIDDRRAKTIAQQVGVQTLGTVGLLVQARKDNFIPALTPLLDALTTSGYFLAPTLIAWAQAEVGEQ